MGLELPSPAEAPLVDALRNQLAALDPPLKHNLESQGDNLVITLIDPERPARVTRTLNRSLVANTPLLYDVIRDAINELRAGGCHPPISEHEVFPDD